MYCTIYFTTLHCLKKNPCKLAGVAKTPSSWQGTERCTALHCIAMHCTALHCTTQHGTALLCTALNCTALHYNALHCTKLHCILHTTYYSPKSTFWGRSCIFCHVSSVVTCHVLHVTVRLSLKQTATSQTLPCYFPHHAQRPKGKVQNTNVKKKTFRKEKKQYQ